MKRRAFTLIEILVTIVIVGAIAAIAIPSFEKVMFEQRLRKAKMDLRVMNSAARMYQAKHGYIWPPSDVMQRIEEINANLGLDLAEPDGFVYRCLGTNPTIENTGCICWAATIFQGNSISYLAGFYECPSGLCSEFLYENPDTLYCMSCYPPDEPNVPLD